MGYSPYHATIYLDTIEVQLASLRAKKECADNYIHNNKMHIECKLLDAQIHALEDEFYRIQEELS